MAPPKKKPTPKTINQAEAAIRSGLSAELAAKTIGISRRTWFRWMKRGKEGERPYTRFVGAVHQAEAELATEALKSIQKAAEDGSWQAAAWLLERRFGYTKTMQADELAASAAMEADNEQSDDYYDSEAGMAELADDLEAIGPDLLHSISQRHPRVAQLFQLVASSTAGGVSH